MARSRTDTVLDAERLVDAPASAVWAVLSDYHRVHVWAPVFVRTEVIGVVTQGIGAARRCHFRFFGSIDEVVVDWQDETRLSYRVSPFGPIRAATSRWEILAEAGDFARVSLRLEYEVRYGVLGRLLDTMVLRPILKRSLPGALALLRRAARSVESTHVRSSLEAR